jgi:hypothetical protein
MEQQETRRMTIIGTSLIAAGVVMAAVGGTLDDQTVVAVLPAIGAALVAAGLAAILIVLVTGTPRSALVGGALIAARTVMAVIGGLSTDPAVLATLPAMGGALLTAGLITILVGVGAPSSQVETTRS